MEKMLSLAGLENAAQHAAAIMALETRLATDPHSPAKFRVNGVVRNIAEFYQAFDIKPGDKLYLAPSERVKIW